MANPTFQKSNHPDPAVRAQFDAMYAERAHYQALRPKIEVDGKAALARLFAVAHGDTGQSKVIAKFLLGCYNGLRFPFDLTDLRMIDRCLFNDCLAVLQMDFAPKQEVHCYFPSGGDKFEALAKGWGIADALRNAAELDQYRRLYGSL